MSAALAIFSRARTMLKLLSATRKHPFLPGLDNPQAVFMDLSSSQLVFNVPAGNECERRYKPLTTPLTSQFDIYNQRGYEFTHEGFSTACLFQRDLDFFSTPSGIKSIGTISVSVAVDQVNCLPNGMTCLNPNHFEQVMLRLLHRLGPGNPGFWKKIAPVNWKVFCRNESTFVMCEMRNDLDAILRPTPYDAMQYTSLVMTALDEQHLLRIMFHNTGYVPDAFATKVRGQISRSIKLNLNENVKRKLSASKSKWPNAKISEYREPENWAYPKWRREFNDIGEPKIVVAKLGSPAPELQV